MLQAATPPRFVPSRRLITVLFLGVALLAGAVAIRIHGEPAPSVVFTNLKGDKIAMNSLRGKVVLVNFWSVGCVVCVRDMPQMTATYNRYKGQGLELVAVALGSDRPDYVLDYAQTRNLPFDVALDTQDDLARAFGGVAATPTAFLIGKDGKIIERLQGEPDFEALHRLLEKELAVAG